MYARHHVCTYFIGTCCTFYPLTFDSYRYKIKMLNGQVILSVYGVWWGLLVILKQ